MKRCSTYIRELQIKTTTRYHHTVIRVGKIQKIDDMKCWQGCGPDIFVGKKHSTATPENSLGVSYKAIHSLTI